MAHGFQQFQQLYRLELKFIPFFEPLRASGMITTLIFR